MKHLIRLSDLTKSDVNEIFKIADDIQQGKYQDVLKGKTIVMFFPSSSIRTRVTFEKGIYLLGGQTIMFDPSTLDKREETKDVIGYLNNWADVLVVRYSDIAMLDKIKQYAKMPVINAMTSINHPCEMLTDLYSLSKSRKDYINDKYLFVGPNGNIGYAWKELSQLMGLSLEQCAPQEYAIDGLHCYHNLLEAVKGKDVVCTDSLGKDKLADFQGYQVTLDIMKHANEDACLDPCPPFYRGEEVSTDVIDSKYFVGYEFKKYLLEIQQAIVIYLLSNSL